MTRDELTLSLQIEHEQDAAKALAWWKEQDDEALMVLWDVINRDYKNPFQEAMSRLARLAYELLALGRLN